MASGQLMLPFLVRKRRAPFATGWTRRQGRKICKRPPLPSWLCEDRSAEDRQGSRYISWHYWLKIYWATPPWLSNHHQQVMIAFYQDCPEGYHVDHIVPLNAPQCVNGLHVPWNLQYLPEQENGFKSNKYWPDMPIINSELFENDR